jgi:uncharacterized cupin superfamily protein
MMDTKTYTPAVHSVDGGSSMTYTRVVRAADDGSSFEDAELQLTRQQIAEGMPAMFAGSLSRGVELVYLRSADFDSAPHPAPREQWVVMLRGAIEVEVTDGTRRRFAPGDLVFVSDTTGAGHITRATGEPPFEALFAAPAPGSSPR